MLDVLVPEIGLQCPRVVAPVRQGIAAGVPKHMRVRLERQLGGLTRPLNHASEPGRREDERELGSRQRHSARPRFCYRL